VGIVLHEALTGRRAFRGPDVRAVLSSVLTKPLVPLATARPDLPGVLDRVIGRATARDPRTRYQSAREFMRDLMVVQTILADHRKARAVTESGTYGSVNDWDMPTKRYTKQARVRA
jgi:serine/threonine protein kinase